MFRFRFFRLIPAAFGLALVAALALAACDSNSAADDADRDKLRGSWFITGLQVDGADEFASLDNQYPNGILFRLRVDESGNELLRVRSRNDRGEDLLDQGGTFDVNADGSELNLRTDHYGFLSLTYNFGLSETDGPTRVELNTQDDIDAAQLIALLGLDGFGNVDNAEITIERPNQRS